MSCAEAIPLSTLSGSGKLSGEPARKQQLVGIDDCMERVGQLSAQSPLGFNQPQAMVDTRRNTLASMNIAAEHWNKDS